MANKAQASIKLIAASDGITLDGYLARYGSYPLYQTYDDANVYIPDFESGGIAETEKPTVALFVANHATGKLMTPQTVDWMYNGVTLAFGGDGLSTNSGMVGMFKKIDNFSASYLGADVTVRALRVMKNLVSLTNMDNDRISASGTVEVKGKPVRFNDVGAEVVIQKRTDSLYYVTINPLLLKLSNEAPSGQLEAQVLAGGNPVKDFTGYTFKWEKITSSGNVTLQSGSSNKVTVELDDVDSMADILCTVSKGSEVVGSGFAHVEDESDPIQVEMTTSGADPNEIYEDDTITITPRAYRLSNYNETLTVDSWDFYSYDEQGKDVQLSGKDSAHFTGKSATVSGADVHAADKGNGALRINAEHQF